MGDYFDGFLVGIGFGLIVLLVAMLYLNNYDYNQISELGSAICDQQNPKHTLEFDSYSDKIVYCKEKPNETSYDGLKIRVGDDSND